MAKTMDHVCSQTSCTNIGTKSCSDCGRVFYCSISCQKQDWKELHKSRCLKLLPRSLLPLECVILDLSKFSTQLQRLIATGGSNEEQILSLKHAIAFAEFQFGVPSTPEHHFYSDRKDGIKVDVLTVAHSMTSLYFNLGTRYSNRQSLKAAMQAETYFRKCRDILEPLRLLIDSNVEEDVPFDIMANKELILEQLSRTERKLAINCMELNHFKESDAHCQRSLSFAKRMAEKGVKKTTVLFDALLCYGELRAHQYWKDSLQTWKGAYDYFEEAYVLVSELYGPVHPQVQEVSVHLIGSLIKLGDFIEAERFARINYESLLCPTSGVGPEDRQVMKGASMLVKICYVTAQQCEIPLVSLEEAEVLARKVVSIAVKTDGEDGYDTGINQFDLYQVLKEKAKANVLTMTEEEKRISHSERLLLLEKSRAVTVRCHGTNSRNNMYMTQEMHLHFLDLYHALPKGKNKLDALSRVDHFEDETVRICIIVNGLAHPFTLTLLKRLPALKIVVMISRSYPAEFRIVAFCIVLLLIYYLRNVFVMLL